MSEFEFWKMAYQLGWASVAQVKQAATLGLITQEEKTIILGY